MIHHAKGTISRQGGVNTPEGTYEESFGRQGFYGPQAKLYRRHATTDWLRIEGPLQPRVAPVPGSARVPARLTASGRSSCPFCSSPARP